MLGLKIYDVPILYFPRFFHPDPTVKRQSGFLMPLAFSQSQHSQGNSFSKFHIYKCYLKDNIDLNFYYQDYI